MNIEHYVGKTVTSAENDGGGWVLTFDDGSTMTIGGCGCCGSPWIDELDNSPSSLAKWDPADTPPIA